MATNEEVEEQRDRVIELRARVQEAKNGSSEAQRELENEIALTQLQAEEASLAAELAEVEHRQGSMGRSATPLVTAKEQMEAAVRQQQAVADTIVAENKASAPAAPGSSVASETKKVGD